jgi:predicted nucleic acid-binding protein
MIWARALSQNMPLNDYVLLAAIIGGRAALVLRHRRSPRCFASQVVFEEIGEHLPGLAVRKGLDADALQTAFTLLPVAWVGSDGYAQFELEARHRIEERDPDDWSTVALSLAMSLPVWSQDKDFSESGLEVFSTGQLLDALRALETLDAERPGEGP